MVRAAIILVFACMPMACLNLNWWKSTKETGQKPANEAKVNETTVMLAERIQDVGQTLVTANPFLGVTPNFYVLTTSEMSIGHPDAFGVFISEPLILKCNTKEDLATVLALELAVIIIEQRNISRLGLPDPTTTVIQGDEITQNPTQDPGAKVVSQAKPREKQAITETPLEIAKTILTAAGFMGDKVEAWQEVLIKVKAKSDPARTLGGSAISPSWSR